MMYDELIKRLRRCEQFHCRECEYENIMGCRTKLNAEAADAIEDLQKQLQKSEEDNVNLTGWLAEEHAKHLWIPVTERLPESGIHVLLACKCGGSSYICDGFHTEKFSLEAPFWSDMDADYNEETDEYYFPEGWWEVIKNWDDYSSVAIEDKVTHWMPLQKPPESEGE